MIWEQDLDKIAQLFRDPTVMRWPRVRVNGKNLETLGGFLGTKALLCGR